MVRRRVVLALAFIAGGTTAATCGGGDNQYAAFVAAYCDVFTPCCAAAGFATDGKLCRAEGAAFPPPGFQKAAGDACLTDLRAAAATADFCKTGDSQVASCQSLFGHHADKAPGDPCATDTDCAPSAEGSVVCTFVTSGSICQVRIAGGAENDTPCVGTTGGDVPFEPPISTTTPARGFLCDRGDGLRCDGTACVALKPVGATCAIETQECVSAAFCQYATLTCVDRKNAGDACGDSSYECVMGTTCGFSNTCVAKGDLGASCQIAAECLSNGCTGGVCTEPQNLGLLLVCGSTNP